MANSNLGNSLRSSTALENLDVALSHKYQTNLQQSNQSGGKQHGKAVGGMDALDQSDMLKAASSLLKATGPLQIQSANLESALGFQGLKLDPAAIFKPAESVGQKWTAHVEGQKDGGHGGPSH